MNNPRLITCLFVAALSLFFIQLSASAQARVFVSGLGSDSNSCSRGFPCRNFQQA